MRSFIQNKKKVLGLVILVSAIFPIQAHALVQGVVGDLVGFLSETLIQIGGLLVGLSGLLLNEVMSVTITGMAVMIDNIGGIELAWEVIRDLMNMIFIFILLYLSITTILKIEGINVKKVLIRVVVAGLLINFSLFFTNVVIDTSNILAIEFHKGIEDLGNKPSTIVGPGSDQTVVSGVSAAFVRPLKLASLFSAKNSTDFGGDSLIIGLAGFTFEIITAFVFFAASILLIMRFVVLVILMILSPFPFIAAILPKTSSYASKWWSALFNQAFFAPVFLGLLFIVGVIVNDERFQQSLGVTSDVTFNKAILGGATAPVAIFINFGIVIGLMIASIVIAKKLATDGGTGIVSGGTKLLGGAALGGTAFLGRNTLGRLGGVATSESTAVGAYLRRKGSQTGFGGFAARQALKAGAGLETGSFDARATKSIGGLSKTAGIDLGKAGGKGGLKKAIETKTKDKEKFAKDYIGGPEENARRRVAKFRREIVDGSKKVSAKEVVDAQKAGQLSYEAQELRARADKSENPKDRQKADKATAAANQAFANLGTTARELANSFENLIGAEDRVSKQTKASRYQYAVSFGGASVPYTGGAVSTRSPSTREFAKKIRESLTKDKSKKLLDDIKEFASEESGEPQPPPTGNEPPAGGGTTEE